MWLCRGFPQCTDVSQAKVNSIIRNQQQQAMETVVAVVRSHINIPLAQVEVVWGHRMYRCHESNLMHIFHVVSRTQPLVDC